MFQARGLALMLLRKAVVGGRDLPPGSVGTEEDFGEELSELLARGAVVAFDPRYGIPEVPNHPTAA